MDIYPEIYINLGFIFCHSVISSNILYKGCMQNIKTTLNT